MLRAMAKSKRGKRDTKAAAKERQRKVKLISAPEGVIRYPSNASAKIKPADIKLFLEALAEGHSVTAACAAIKFSREHMYLLRYENPEFADRWTKALELGTHALEDLAITRARAYSDNLLMFMLKKRDPAFRDRGSVGGSVNLPGANGVPGGKVEFTFDFGSGAVPRED